MKDYNKHRNFASSYKQFQTSSPNSSSSTSSLSDDVSPRFSMPKRRDTDDSGTTKDYMQQKMSALMDAADTLASLGRSPSAACSQSSASSIGFNESATYGSSFVNDNGVTRAVSSLSSLSKEIFTSCTPDGSSNRGDGSFIDAPGGFGKDDGAVPSGEAEKAAGDAGSAKPSKMKSSIANLPVVPKERYIPTHKKETCALTFPEKLMSMLDYAEETKDKSDDPANYCISWLPHGDAFLVRYPTECAETIIPLFFKAAKFSSFTRKLYRWGFRQVEREHKNGHLFPPDAMIFASEHFKRDARHEMANMRSNTASDQKRKIIASIPIALIHNSSANSLTGTRADGGSLEDCLTVGLESSAPKRVRSSFDGFESSEASMQSKRNCFSSRRDSFLQDTGIYTPRSFQEGANATLHALDVLKKSALDHRAITSLMQNDQCNSTRENIMPTLFSRGNSSTSTIQVKLCPSSQYNPFLGPQQNMENSEVTHHPSENIQGHAASVGIPIAPVSIMENPAFMQALASMVAGSTHSTGQFKALPPPIVMSFAPAPSPEKRVHRQSDRNLSMKSPQGTPQNSTSSSLPGVMNMTNATKFIHGNDNHNASYQYAFAQALRTLLLPQSGSPQQTVDTFKASMLTNRSSSVPGDQPVMNTHQSLLSEKVRKNFASVSSSELLSGQVDSDQEKSKLAMLFRSAAETLEKENSYGREQPLSMRTSYFQHQGSKGNHLDQQLASSQQRRHSLENGYVAGPLSLHPTNVAAVNISMVTEQNQHCGNHVSGRVTSLSNPLNSSSGARDHSHAEINRTSCYTNDYGR